MDAASVFRTLLVVRGGWAVIEWFFDLGPQRIDSLSLLHPLASLFAHAIAVAFLLVILTGLWFFHRWARFLFVLLLAIAVLYSTLRPRHIYLGLPSSAFSMISLLILMLTAAIVTMSFLPPVRERFATQT